MGAQWREKLPTTLMLDRDERSQYDHAHFAYIVGTGVAAISPTWVVIYSLSGNEAKYNASLSSVRWLCLEESAQMIFLAIAHVRFWKLFVDYRKGGSASSMLYRLGRACMVVPEWLFARLTLLPILAELVLYGCTSRNAREKDGADYGGGVWHLATCPVATTRVRDICADWRRHSTACPVLFQIDPQDVRHLWRRYRSS